MLCGASLLQGFYQVNEKAPERVPDFVTACFNNIPGFQGSTNQDKTENDFAKYVYCHELCFTHISGA